jgi:hypothetical protein
MTDDTGTDQRGERRPYIKPFVRNLDASDTEGKTHSAFEHAIQFASPGQTVTVGPS